MTSPLTDAVLTASGTKVLNRERAAGVDQRLQWALDEWEREGTHVIRVAGGTYTRHEYVGGVRTLEQQLSDFNAGLSKADRFELAPHMHGGALDLWPEHFVPNRGFDTQPVPEDYVSLFRAQAEFFKARGFVCGFYWPNPDMPHIEVPDWRKLPAPLLVTQG